VERQRVAVGVKADRLQQTPGSNVWLTKRTPFASSRSRAGVINMQSDRYRARTAGIVKRSVDATTDELVSELHEALKGED
jgi:hypothetical protein